MGFSVLRSDWASINDQTSSMLDAKPSVILRLLSCQLKEVGRVEYLYLELHESIRHLIFVMVDFDITFAIRGECLLDRELQLIVASGTRKAISISNMAKARRRGCTYFATNTQASGANRPCALAGVTGCDSRSSRGENSWRGVTEGWIA